MPYLDRDGTGIYYQLSGHRNGATPLLLSHGFAGASAHWQPNVPAIAATRPVIVWDLRGHGRSDSPDALGSYTAAACVADMTAILDACAVPRVVAGGLSLGGYLSLAFGLSQPDRVAGLLLCDTGPGFRSDEARDRWNDRAVALAGRLDRDGLAALGDGPAVQLAGHRSARGLALAARGLLTQRDAQVISGLPSIDVPALVLAGARDHNFRPAQSYLVAKLPRAEQAVIPDAGHLSNLDQPDLFNQQVLAFLDQPALR